MYSIYILAFRTDPGAKKGFFLRNFLYYNYKMRIYYYDKIYYVLILLYNNINYYYIFL